MLDWSEGLVLKQLRVQPRGVGTCETRLYGTQCLPELGAGASVQGSESTAAFGYNWTHPTSPLAHPWRHFSAEELGANPHGYASAAVPSFRTFDTGGFVAIVLPFLSTTLLPEQRGTSDQVEDFRQHALTRSSADSDRRAPLYVCVRLSWNGGSARACTPVERLPVHASPASPLRRPVWAMAM